MARSLRVVGLACALLFAGVAAVAAQSETWSAPPIRLPGIAYPKPADAGVRATTPKLKPKAQSDRAPSAPKTTQGATVAPEGRTTSTPTPGEHSLNVKLPGVAYPGASATRAVAPALGPKDRSTQPLQVPAAREPPSSIPMIPPEIAVAPQTSHGLLTAPDATKPVAIEPPKREPTPEPAGNDGQQELNTETAETATHATSAPEPGISATLPNGTDAPTATSLAPRQDFAPSFLKSNQQNTVSNVVVLEKLPELFFHEGAKIIELLQATGYSDYAPHEIPPEVIALEPVLGMFLFVKRPDGDIGLVSEVTHRALGILKYGDASAPQK